MDDVLSDKARTAAMSVSAEDGEEEELVILEICINSGDQGSVSTPVAASKLPPPSTPCSLIRRLGCQDDLLAGRPASGPVRVVLNTRPDLGREAEPAIRKGLDELVAQAQAALLEATPVLKRAAGDLHKSPVRTLTLSAGDIERPKVDAADEETGNPRVHRSHPRCFAS